MTLNVLFKINIIESVDVMADACAWGGGGRVVIIMLNCGFPEQFVQ